LPDVPSHVSIVKITHPKCSGVFPRERLFRRLDAERDRPVVWISAPAGSGKTTLVASYLLQRKIPSIWYRVDEGDADIATFFYYMGLAGQKAVPHHPKSLPLFTPEYLKGIPAFTLRYFEKLFGGLPPPFVIVFDNYQHVTPYTGFHQVICDGMGIVPDQVRVIFISREAPPPAFARLRAGRKVGFLRSNEVQFTLEETRKLVRLKSAVGPSAGALRQLHAKTRGWAAGLVLMMEHADGAAETGWEKVAGQTPQEVFDYFATEIYTKMDRRQREFLLQTAFLPGMTVRTARQLTGVAQTAAILSGLYRRHFFVEKSSEPDPVYRYHPLFQEFLLSMARDALKPETIHEIRHSAAGLLVQSGRIEDAADLFLADDDWEAMTGFVLNHARSLMEQGRSRTVETWIGKMPPEIVNDSPWLLYWMGVCRLAPDPFESRGYFESAFGKFQRDKEPAGMLLAWSGVVESILFAWDNYKILDTWIDWFDKHMAANREFPGAEIEARVAASMAGALCLRCPQRADAKHWIERALALARGTGDIHLQFAALHHAVFYHMQIGDFAALDGLIQQAKEIAMAPDASAAILLRSKAFEPMRTEVSPVDYRQTVTDATECLDMARETGANMLDFWLYAHGVYGAFCTLDLKKAAEFLRGMEAACKNAPRISLDQYYFLLGWYHFLQGKSAQALNLAQKSLSMILESGLSNPEIVCRQLVARLLHANGKKDAARKQLETVKKLAAELGRDGYFYHVCLLIEAQFDFECGDEKNGLACLAQALAIGRKRAYMTLMFSWQRPVMADLYRRALEAGIELDYVRDFVRAYRLIPDPIPVDSETWPWPLKIYTLGRFGLLRDDHLLTWSGRGPKKPLLLLQMLIALGGREIRSERLADRLWPDADGDRAHSAFTTNLLRLRRFIGSDDAVSLQDGRLSLNSSYCWLDVWAFQEMLLRTESLLKETGRFGNNRSTDCQADHPWVRPLRNRLRRQFGALAGRLIGCLDAEGQRELAAESFQMFLKRAQEKDAELAQNLMTCRPRSIFPQR